MILFLDFDGVVHPEPCTQEEAFTSLPLIEAVLREFPQVDIVISSAWRLDYANTDEALQGLKPHFSQDIQHRVVGITGEAIHMPLQDTPPGLGLYIRQAECVAWLRQQRPSLTPWLALDDRDYLFQPFCPNLMLLDGQRGFLPEHQEVLRQHLRAPIQSNGNTAKGGV